MVSANPTVRPVGHLSSCGGVRSRSDFVLVVAMAGFEGVLHAGLHQKQVSHPDGLTIGASPAAPMCLSPDAET